MKLYVATSTNFNGVDLVISYVCVGLWDDGRCIHARAEAVDHAMLESYTTVYVCQGGYVASEGAVSLELTSQSRREQHTDEDGWMESSRTPDVAIDVTYVFERDGAHVLMGVDEKGEAVAVSDEVSIPPGIASMLM